MKVTLISHALAIQKKIEKNLTRDMARAALLVANQAKKNVSKAPPAHPQVQTGRLRSSVTSKVDIVRNEITGTVGTNVEYGEYLEFGTSRIPAYPWLFPAVEMKKNEIVEALKGKEFTIT